MADAPNRSHARRTWTVVAAIVLIVAIVGGVQVWGAARYRASSDATRPLNARLADAKAAYGVMPLWPAYRIRVLTLRGLILFERNDILAAYALLHPEFVRQTIAKKFDAEFVAAHEIVKEEYFAVSSRNAHQMHGHERADGTIAPEDVEQFPQPTTTAPVP